MSSHSSPLLSFGGARRALPACAFAAAHARLPNFGQRDRHSQKAGRSSGGRSAKNKGEATDWKDADKTKARYL